MLLRRLTWNFALLAIAVPGLGAAEPKPTITLSVADHHPWTPPFHLDRVDLPTSIQVKAETTGRPVGLALVAYRAQDETGRHPLEFPATAPFVVSLPIDAMATRVVVVDDASREVGRLEIERPDLSADGVASPSEIVNPVDFGTILHPSDWLLLGPGQDGWLDFAGFNRGPADLDVSLRIRYEASPESADRPFSIPIGRKTVERIRLPRPTADTDRDVLNVSLIDVSGKSLWSKSIPVMLVDRVAERPAFGAYETILRYDPPISVRDPATGAFSSLDYAKGWAPELKDVVVNLPNGGRFVFWRGSSYIPFWAGRYNTGACYEWAEITSRLPDAVDCVEPLMDKELRYGRVQIVESSRSRVHVRWTYQSTDLNYKVWGDQAVEDYYFYPDGFGTRVVSLKAGPATEYELNELIVLTPQSTYPFDVLPENLVDALSLDGSKRSYRFPIPNRNELPTGKAEPTAYRLRLNRRETQSAICFNPGNLEHPPVVFDPFYERVDATRTMVTPCYWGSHWPLARGNATGSKIDDRVALSPCHNSVMSWATKRPTPISEGLLTTLDVSGKPRPTSVRRWAWLIGMTDADDAQVVERARSYASPPTLSVKGGRVAFEGWSPERRALSLEADSSRVEIEIRPDASPCVNPVFEISGMPAGSLEVTIDGTPAAAGSFAWDGKTLWLDATLRKPALIVLEPDQP